MKSVAVIALALAFFACSVSAQATTLNAQKTGKQVRKHDLHSGCNTKHAKMTGAPCH